MSKRKQGKANVLLEVLGHFECSPTKLAEALNEPNRQTVHNWKARGIPLAKCVQIHRLTGIPLSRLRPRDWHLYWPDGKPPAERPRARA